MARPRRSITAYRLLTVALIIAAIFCGEPSASANPGPPAIVFKGHLEQDGLPATGMYDLDIKLFRSLAGNDQIDYDFPFAQIPVVGGEFSAVVGPLTVNQMSADSIYLEVSVGNVTLTGRQRVYRSPLITGTIESVEGKNSFNGLLEAYYAPNDRYGIAQIPGGITAI